MAKVNAVESDARRKVVHGVLPTQNVLSQRLGGGVENVECDIEFADTLCKRSQLIGNEKVQTTKDILGLCPVCLS